MKWKERWSYHKNVFGFINIYVFGFLLLFLFYLPCFFSISLTDQLTKEDGFYEWLGAIFFFATAFCFFMLWYRKRKKKWIAERSRRYRWVYFLFFLLFLFAFGEEISWGQRLLGYGTPEYFADMNMQGEVNVHNLAYFHGLTDSGNRKTGIAALLNMQALFYLAFVVYLVVFTVWADFSVPFKRFLYKLGIPLPPLIIGGFFILNWAYGNLLRFILSGIDGHSIVEIKEAGMSVILFMIPVYFLCSKEEY